MPRHRFAVVAALAVLALLATPAIAAAPNKAWRGQSGIFGATITVYGYASGKIKVVATPTCDTSPLRTVTGSYRVRYQRTDAASSCSYGPDPFVAKRLAGVPGR